jgi:glutamate-1-semialdehyde aminotransferase
VVTANTPQISTIEQFVTFTDRYTRIISPQYREGVKGYIGGALSQVFPVGGSSNTKMSLGRTETLFERAEALTTAGQQRFTQFQKAMLRQRILFMPIALFHQGISAAHTKEDIESILNAMRVALQARQ